jgi:probable rRNA maturation factor
MSSPEGSTVSFRRVLPDVRPLALRRFARRLQREVCRGRSFACLVTGDAELRRLNREFRGKDYATDVLSFPIDGAPAGVAPGEGASLGDIAISFQRARAQAREFGHEPEREVRILMLHGVLHLMGMDHETGPGMARAEKQWRARLRLPAGLIERSRP